MSRASVIVQGRAFQEASFTETVKAGPLIESEDPTSGELVKSVRADQTGPALVKYPTLTVSDRSLPGQVVAVSDIVVKRPITAAVLPVGQWFEVTASLSDPSLVGRRFRVKAAPQSGQTTSHRYPVSEEN